MAHRQVGYDLVPEGVADERRAFQPDFPHPGGESPSRPGRDSGFLAVMSAIAGGADAVMVPEFETQPEELLELLNESYEKGKPRFTVVAAEGASPSAEEFRDYVNEAGGSYQADLTVLGRILAGRLGAAAVEALADDEAGTMVGLSGDRIERIPLDEVVDEQRPLDPDLYNLAGVLSALPE